ncbi:MAG: rRNA pseudouridine synthase [Bacteroidota bacterium]|nr:rRNA pseudouridine synthase [Bacteroidota bacterium]
MAKASSGFERFYKGGPKKGGAKKEEFRKEKREAKKEREERFKQAKQAKQSQQPARSRFGVTKAGQGTPEKRAEAPKYNLEAPKGKFKVQKAKPVSDEMPLNKYIAHSGVCSRRDAVDLIKGGKVKVNGTLVLEPGHKVKLTDTVAVAGKKIAPVDDLVYILLIKPKDYITTTDDPHQRKTVLDLLKSAPNTRFYPVGRLDRNTSGVLLLTNDGDLAQMLTHPSNEIKKVYAVTLDKPLTKAHFDAILKGVPLEDGVANVDVLAFPDAKDLTQVGVEIHSGRNRVVRRIFEHYGYDVKALDRVVLQALRRRT